jgi:hypothetical protein
LWTPYTVAQLVCLAFLGALAFVAVDGARDAIVNALIVIAGGNALGGAAYGVAHVIANGRIQQTALREVGGKPA